MKPTIITIDGPAGVGKSTLAKLLAEKLGLPYLDTGAMFRFLALKLGSEALNLPESKLRELASQWRFTLAGAGANTKLLANGEDVGEEIRSEETGRLASLLGAREEIRALLRDAQRKIGQNQSLVAEGRDLGTVVFPDARVKFFLDASPRVRAERRWKDLQNRANPPDLASLERMIASRDAQDRNRAIAPLRAAADATEIDTTNLTLAEALDLLAAETELKLAGGPV